MCNSFLFVMFVSLQENSGREMGVLRELEKQLSDCIQSHAQAVNIYSLCYSRGRLPDYMQTAFIQTFHFILDFQLPSKFSNNRKIYCTWCPEI